MKTYHLTTNIKCNACVAKVTEKFKQDDRIKSFKVDLNDEKRTMEVEVEDELSERAVKEYLKEIGYYGKTAEKSFWSKLF